MNRESINELRIGFDLDGVIATCDSIIWAFMSGNTILQKLACEEAKPNPHFNPNLLLNDADVGFIITARNKQLHEITTKWVTKFYPQFPLIRVDVEQWVTSDGWNKWYNAVANAKADIINKLNLDVYFEDMPVTVRKLRELCPNTKIIQVGGRIE